MKTVRQGTFETNSSSTHAIVMYSDTEATMMKNGEAWCSNEEKIWTADEIATYLKNNFKNNEKYSKDIETVTPATVKSVIQKVSKGRSCADFRDIDYEKALSNTRYGIIDSESATLELLIEADFCFFTSVDAWLNSQDEYETFSDSYTLPDGHVVYAEGYYGYS